MVGDDDDDDDDDGGGGGEREVEEGKLCTTLYSHYKYMAIIDIKRPPQPLPFVYRREGKLRRAGGHHTGRWSRGRVQGGRWAGGRLTLRKRQAHPQGQCQEDPPN